MKHQVSVFAETQCLLGEGCHWNSKRQSLFWVDILDNKLFEKSIDEALRTYALPCMATATFEHNNESIIYLLTEQGIATFNLDTQLFTCLVPFNLANTAFRPNDAGIDPYGNLVFGIMQRFPDQCIGSIYKVGHDGKIVKSLEGIGIPNTFQWTDDGKKLLMADSYKQEMYQFEYNKNGIEQDSSKVFFSTKNSAATPDGSTMSNNGLLWNAQWDGFCVKAYDDQGSNIHSIDLPVPRPTSCTFGGISNQYLFITSARTELSDDQLLAYPESGAVFMVKTDYLGKKPSTLKIE